MASSPSIAATRSVASAKVSGKVSAKVPGKPGLFAEMLRLWLAHHHRLAQVGMLPL